MGESAGLWGTLLDLVLPRPCPGCGGPDPWCAACAATLAGRPRQMAIRPDPDPDAGEEVLPPAYALARYRGPVRAAIIAGKERGRRDLPPRLGGALGAGLERLIRISVITEPVWLVPAPSRRSAARERGGDPVLRMAVAAADMLAARGRFAGVAPCLFTARGASDSVGLDPSERRANLRARVRWVPAGAPPQAAAVVVVDDVLTTGATAGAAAAALGTHGHRVAAVVVLAAVPVLR